MDKQLDGFFPKGSMPARLVDSGIMAAGAAIGSKADDNSTRGAVMGAMAGAAVIWMLTGFQVLHTRR